MGGRGLRSAVVVAVWGGVLLSGCASESPRTDPTPPRTPTELVASVKRAFAGAGSVSWRVEGGTEQSTWGWSETGAGRQTRVWRRDAPSQRRDGTQVRPTGQVLLRTGEVVCASDPQPPPSPPRHRTYACTYDARLFDWVDKQELTADDPSTWITALRGADDLEELGREEVDGVDLQHLRFEAELEAWELRRGTVDLWLDDEDRPRRMVMDDVVNEPPATTRYEATFTGYGGTVDLTPPPYRQMVDWAALQRASISPERRACMQMRCPKVRIPPPERPG